MLRAVTQGHQPRTLREASNPTGVLAQLLDKFHVILLVGSTSFAAVVETVLASSRFNAYTSVEQGSDSVVTQT